MKSRTAWSLGLVAAGTLIAFIIASRLRPQEAADATMPPPKQAEPTAPHSLPTRTTPAIFDQGASASRPTASAAKNSGTPPVWELCGSGSLRMPPGTGASAPTIELPAHLGAIPTAELIERTKALLNRGNPRQRATAFMLNLRSEQTEATTEQLARLAASSKDPLVISWALNLCDSKPACGVGLARAWTQIEPDNAAAWLALAASEPAAATEVRSGLVAAKHFSTRQGALVHEAMQGVPTDAPPYLRFELAILFVGYDIAVSMPNLKPLIALCMPAPAPGTERQATCSAVAGMVTEHSDTLLGYAIGTRMGEQAGWSASRMAELRAQRKRLDAAMRESERELVDMQQPMSCKSIDRGMRHLQERGELGELGYLKRKAALLERR